MITDAEHRDGCFQAKKGGGPQQRFSVTGCAVMVGNGGWPGCFRSMPSPLWRWKMCGLSAAHERVHTCTVATCHAWGAKSESRSRNHAQLARDRTRCEARLRSLHSALLRACCRHDALRHNLLRSAFQIAVAASKELRFRCFGRAENIRLGGIGSDAERRTFSQAEANDLIQAF